MTRAILGLDPGPSVCGWMMITSALPSDAHVFVDGGKVDATRAALLSLFEQSLGRTDLTVAVAIERPRWQDHGRDPRATRAIASNLLETNYVVGRFAEIVVASGTTVIELPAQTWRRGLLGNRAANDAEIKVAVESLVLGLPKRTNEHMRDAGGVAIAAARLIANGREREYGCNF